MTIARMKNYRFIVIILFSFFAFNINLFAGDTLTLKEALRKKLISVTIHGVKKNKKSFLSHNYYGPCLQLEVENLTDSTLNLKLETGTTLNCENESVQNMIVTKELVFSLDGKKSDSFKTYAMCIQEHDDSPDEHSVFHLGELADDKLVKFTKIIEKYNFQDAAGQSAVWVFTDNSDTSSITATNRDETRKLKKFINKLKYNDSKKIVDPEDFQGEPKIVSDKPPTITANMIWEMKKSGRASLKVYDTDGKLIETVFEKQMFGKGECSYYVTLSSDKLEKGKKYFLRLKTKGAVTEELDCIAE
jgi:hypothetical protein